MAKSTVHLLVGPVGAGKTTYAKRRIAESPAVFFDLDTWMVRLFGDDPRPEDGVLPWYLERRERCRKLIWDLALEVLACERDVFLELGLVVQAERAAFYEQVHRAEIPLKVYLVDAPRSVRRERTLARNRSPGPHTQIVPVEFFEQASDAWQEPTETERQTWGIIDV